MEWMECIYSAYEFILPNGNKAVENYPADTSYFTTAPLGMK